MEIKIVIFSILLGICEGFKLSKFNHLNRPRIGEESACLVTANLLYSHGYFVRELSPAEQLELTQYEQELDNYNKQLADFLHTAYISHPPAFNWIYGSRMIMPRLQQAMPRRPSLPSFCNSRDTAIYKLNGCVVQNYRIFIGSLYVRHLNDDERREMDEYEYRLREYQNEIFESMKKQPRQNWDVPEDFQYDAWDDEKPVKKAFTTSTTTTTTTTTTTEVPQPSLPVMKPKTSILPPQTPKFCTQLY